MALALLLAAASARAGAWTREAGHGYAKLGLDLYRTSALVAPGTGVPTGGSYAAEQLGGYAELGLPAGPWRAHLGLAGSVIAGHHVAEVSSVLGTQAVRASSTRAGDLRVVPQLALHPEWPLAFALDAKVPLTRNDRVGGDSSWAVLFPRPGDGQVDLTPAVWAGGARGRTFGEVSLGWRHRTGWFLGTPGPDFRDGPVASGKVGVDLGRVLPLVGVDLVACARPDEVTREALTLSGAALVDLVDGALALEPRVAVEPWARNASRGVGVSLGISARR